MKYHTTPSYTMQIRLRERWSIDVNVLPVNLLGSERLLDRRSGLSLNTGLAQEQLNGDTGLQTSYGGGRETFLCLSLPLCSS